MSLSVVALDESTTERVVVSVWERLDRQDLQHYSELSVAQLQDGVAVTVRTPRSDSLPSLLGMEDHPAVRPAPVSGSLTLSGGAQWYDGAGSPIVPNGSFWREHRAMIGLPPNPSYPLSNRSRPGVSVWQGKERRGWNISAQDAERELTDLRNFAAGQERLGPKLLRFNRTGDEVEETWIFDEEIGAVVEHTIARGTRPQVRIKNDYSAEPDGYRLVRSVSEWTTADGRVIRRVEKVFGR